MGSPCPAKRHGKMIDAMFRMMGMLVSGGGGNMLDDVYLQGHEKPEHIYSAWPKAQRVTAQQSSSGWG